MTEQEYFLAINTIREKISQGNLNHIQEELEELFCYKPVRLLWFMAKAEFYFAIGDKEKVWPVLGDKFVRLNNYPGMEDVRDFHIKWAINHNDKRQEKRLEKYYSKIIDNVDIDNNEEIEIHAQKVEACNYTFDLLGALCSKLIINNRVLEYFIILQYLIEKGHIKRDEKGWFYSLPNYGYLLEQLQGKTRLFLIVSNDLNKQVVRILSYVISELGHSVYIVVEDEGIALNDFETSETILQKSIENSWNTEYASYIPAFSYHNHDGLVKNNIDLIIEFIYKTYSKDEFAILISEADIMLNLMQHSILRKNIEALVEINTNFNKNFCFAWLGNYLGYLESIYNENVAESLEALDECRFSIVIPARNAAGTLQYTIQTCLNQDFKGSFEIIISDNSQEGYNEIKSLCEDLNDSRIKYYRTPRDLQLTKSFEYAFLKARGTFILAVGSDDGLFSWALSTLDEVMNAYPNESIIQWKRGFYAWPGFNGGQENELIVLNKPENFQVTLKNSLDYFAVVLSNTQNIFSLPLLYINSGFQRKYLKELLMKTGRLWDGCNQDVSIGIINVAINKTILNIDYPITVAGLSEGSMGYRSMTARKEELSSDSEVQKKLNSNVAIYCSNSYEKLIPHGKDEVCSLYWNILRAIRLGIISDEWLTDLLDFKKIFIEFFSQHTCMDVYYDKYLHNARYLAIKRGPDFLNWFDNEIYYKTLIPKYIPEGNNSHSKKSYQEGRTKEGNLIIDASKYKVRNIAEAIALSEKIYNEEIQIKE